MFQKHFFAQGKAFFPKQYHKNILSFQLPTLRESRRSILCRCLSSKIPLWVKTSPFRGKRDVDKTAKPRKSFSVPPPFREGRSARPLSVGRGVSWRRGRLWIKTSVAWCVLVKRAGGGPPPPRIFPPFPFPVPSPRPRTGRPGFRPDAAPARGVPRPARRPGGAVCIHKNSG